MRVMLIQGGTRSKETCPGKDTKLQYIIQQLKKEAPDDVEIDVLDLAVKGDGVIVQPCKGCIGTAGGYHCQWRTAGVEGDEKVRGCTCYGPGSNSPDLPDLLHQEHAYYRMQQADAIMILSPIHWYNLSAPVLTMLSRLVCASGTVPAEIIAASHPEGSLKDAQHNVKLEESKVFDQHYKNHLEGKIIGIWAQGDDGADDFQEGPFPKTFGTANREEFLELSGNISNLVTYQVQKTFRYLGLYVPDNLVTVETRNYKNDYADNDKTFKSDEDFIESAKITFNALIAEIRLRKDDEG